MRLILKFFFFLLLLTSPLSVNSSEPEVLYLWQISSGHEWESYGDENVQQKYEGITSNGEPDGKGILSFPDGKRVTGEWKNGNEWNTDHFNNEGKLIGRTAKGKYIIGAGEKIKMVLFLRKVSGRWGWHEEGIAGKDYKYEGTIENGKPNGSGIYDTPGGNQYIGDFKDGKKHGQSSRKHSNESVSLEVCVEKIIHAIERDYTTVYIPKKLALIPFLSAFFKRFLEWKVNNAIDEND